MKMKTLLFTAVDEGTGISEELASSLCSEISTLFEKSATMFSSKRLPPWGREYNITVHLADPEREEALLRNQMRKKGFTCYTNNGHL